MSGPEAARPVSTTRPSDDAASRRAVDVDVAPRSTETVRPVVEVAAPGADRLPAIELDGHELHAITEADCVARILAAGDEGLGGFVVTHNLDHLRRLTRDPAFAAVCRRADLRVADGMPLVWAASVQGTPLPERVAGSNLIWSLSEGAATRGRSVYMLGGDPGTAEAAGEALVARYPGLRLAGFECPEFGFEKSEDAIAAMRERVQQSGADIVYVALGSPKQEFLIDRLRSALPHAWWVGVGISFSFVTGDVVRAPGWMQRLGLEWVHRMVQEPRRLARRYLVDGIPYALGLLWRAWRGRSAARSV